MTPRTLVAAGFGAGVTGTATSIGGPAIALLFQREPPAVMRSTLSVFFFVGVLLSLTGLGISGSLSAESWQVALVLAPGVVVGMLVGRAVRDRIQRRRLPGRRPRRLHRLGARPAGPFPRLTPPNSHLEA